jgi:hypothetical protein
VKPRILTLRDGRLTVNARLMPDALRQNRPNRRDADEAADVIEELLRRLDQAEHIAAVAQRNGGIVRLTDLDMSGLKADIQRDPEVGRRILRDAGIIGAKGGLTKQYGGTERQVPKRKE